MKQTLPSDALTKRPHPIRKIAIIAAPLLGAALLIVGAIAISPALKSALNHPTPTASAAPADSPMDPLTDEELAGIEQAAQSQHDTIAADDAAAAAAAQAAQDAANKAAKHSSGPVRCPAGSSANSNDGVNDTSCFPDICFHLTLPDPAHPECDVAFKP
jgi:hypothetical protein